jgi:hypothetical protein
MIEIDLHCKLENALETTQEDILDMSTCIHRVILILLKRDMLNQGKRMHQISIEKIKCEFIQVFRESRS